MKRCLGAIFLLICFGSEVVCAQGQADYHDWMKEIGSTHSALRKALKSKSGTAAADDASKMAVIFAQVGQYWQKRDVSDAVTFAAEAASGLRRVATLSTAGKFDEASAALKAAESDCSACHKAHRGVSLHGWTIK